MPVTRINFLRSSETIWVVFSGGSSGASIDSPSSISASSSLVGVFAVTGGEGMV